MATTRIVNGMVGGAPFLVLFAAVRYESWLPVILFVAFVVLAYPCILIFSPLHPLSDEGVQAARSGRTKEVLVALGVLGFLAVLGLTVD